MHCLNLFNVFTVNAGKDDGVAAGSIVVNEDGLVGKVVTVGKNWAKVLGHCRCQRFGKFHSSSGSGSHRGPLR